MTGTQKKCSAQIIAGEGVAVESAGITFWEAVKSVFPKMAEGGLPIAMADSPAPGPADGAALLIIAGGSLLIGAGVYGYEKWIKPYVTSEPQTPTIIVDPLPDITLPQIESIPQIEPGVKGNIPPITQQREEAGSNITGIPLPEENGAKIITSYGEDVINDDGGKKSLSDLPENVQDSFNKYDKAGWQGNVTGQTPGTNAGRRWGNRDSQLPTVDVNGETITYREFDVNNYNGIRRDGERFIVGSDGSVWYTDSHYGQSPSLNGISDFVRIK